MLKNGSLIDGKYKILNKIGSGGMSVVYLAMNEKANKQWAIKEVRRDGVRNFETIKQSLVMETDLLKKLKHPGLPSIVDIIEDEDSFLIVMDYIEGNPLSVTLNDSGAQPQQNVIRWAIQLCDVLSYLHSRNPPIIYRDMKPGNIMLKPNGDVMLIDFGIAREFKEKNSTDTTCLGTVGYAAPEQFGGMGQTDVRTDIYCFGATLYHLVTGASPCEYPYQIRPIRQIDPSLSGGLEKIILKCTRQNPEERYQNCAQIMYALKHYEEIDDAYRRSQVKKLGIFTAGAALTVALAMSSMISYLDAENKKKENYDEILKTASEYEDYYTAMLTDATRTEAYAQLNDMVSDDLVLTRDEARQIEKLMTGIEETDENGYTQIRDVLSELKKADAEGYENVCYEIGSTFLFYYDIGVDKDRYDSAKRWFAEAADSYPIAKLYCDISDCLDLIDKYDGAKIKQTEKMYGEYDKLWNKICKLEGEADAVNDTDAKLLIWTEINGVINGNVMTFSEIVPSDDIRYLLEDIYDKANSVQRSIINDEIEDLKDSVAQTIQKIDLLGYIKGR